MAVYEIDSSAVNQRNDWRHQRQPAQLAARRVDGFPGDPNRYLTKGPLRPRTIRVSGILTDSTWAGLYGQLDTYESMQADDTTHSVSIHGVTYSNMDLAAFRQTGRHRPDGDGNVRVPVEFTWQQLTR